ncbi:hypothetical protein QBC34DRAFT_410167 [Podospora aff. communis PSN243]|uniref:Uncharacterized protein n=1 Tax=Podospora aff. communis PSN243 TaxID=3040156 RepID=A0AAV9GJR2_9PEZI|nr:hypothetical protein QBC34DRAFT_410167 [Podospora aff. communis PSN243]
MVPLFTWSPYLLKAMIYLASLCSLPAVLSAPLRSREDSLQPLDPNLNQTSPGYKVLPVFQDKTQFDIITVLLLLGEASIWRVIWSRFRFRRLHWTQWIFAISPGWAPLAASVFSTLQGSRGPPNLIFDRPPVESLNDNLVLTNLYSGASHSARNVRLQNIWQTWHRGPRRKHRYRQEKWRDVTREVGVVDVELDLIHAPISWTFILQAASLSVQLGVALGIGFFGYSFEVLLSFILTLLSQGLLIAAVTPRPEAWNNRDLTIHKEKPVMLHMGMDSMSVLIVRSVKLNGKGFNLEEFCWEAQALRNNADRLKVLFAGLAFLGFVVQILLIGWMSSESRMLYLALGGLGLLANAVEGAFDPEWCKLYNQGCRGEPFCEPKSSTLMAAVGLLLAGGFPAAEAVSKLLYPDNDRFSQSRSNLTSIFQRQLCDNCRTRVRSRPDTDNDDPGATCLQPHGNLCHVALGAAIYRERDKQVRDGMAAVYHYLRLGTKDEKQPRVVTKSRYRPHAWKTQ